MTSSQGRERTTGEHTVFLRRDFEQARDCYLSLPEDEKESYIERRCSYVEALKKVGLSTVLFSISRIS